MVREIMNENWRRRTCKMIIAKAVIHVRTTMIPRLRPNIVSSIIASPPRKTIEEIQLDMISEIGLVYFKAMGREELKRILDTHKPKTGSVPSFLGRLLFVGEVKNINKAAKETEEIGWAVVKDFEEELSYHRY